jgi:hypothetical protein
MGLQIPVDDGRGETFAANTRFKLAPAAMDASEEDTAPLDLDELDTFHDAHEQTPNASARSVRGVDADAAARPSPPATPPRLLDRDAVQRLVRRHCAGRAGRSARGGLRRDREAPPCADPSAATRHPCAPVPAMVGRWLPVRERSDSYAPILKAMGVGWLGRTIVEKLRITTELYYEGDDLCVLGSSSLGDALDRFSLTGRPRRKRVNEPAGTPVAREVWQQHAPPDAEAQNAHSVQNAQNAQNAPTVTTVTTTFGGDAAQDAGIVVESVRSLESADVMLEKVTLTRFRAGAAATSPRARRASSEQGAPPLALDALRFGGASETTVVVQRVMRRDPAAPPRPLGTRRAEIDKLARVATASAHATRATSGSHPDGPREGRDGRVGSGADPCSSPVRFASLADDLGARLYSFVASGGANLSSPEISKIPPRAAKLDRADGDTSSSEAALAWAWARLVRGAPTEQRPEGVALARPALREALRVWFLVWAEGAPRSPCGKPKRPHALDRARRDGPVALSARALRRLARAAVLLRSGPTAPVEAGVAGGVPAAARSEADAAAARLGALGEACGGAASFADFFAFVERDARLLERLRFRVEGRASAAAAGGDGRGSHGGAGSRGSRVPGSRGTRAVTFRGALTCGCCGP